MTYIEMMRDGMTYLRYDQQAVLLTWERSPWHEHNPDIFAVFPDRRTTEIEIKRSLADFKKDKEKYIWNRRKFGQLWPHRFYYFVPPELVDKVTPLLEHGCGLLTKVGRYDVTNISKLKVVVKAKVQPTAHKLTTREIVEMAKHQSGAMVAMMKWVAKEEDATKELAPFTNNLGHVPDTP